MGPLTGLCGAQYPIKTRLSLSGTLVVARDIAHAKLKEVLVGLAVLDVRAVVVFAHSTDCARGWAIDGGVIDGLQRLDEGKGLPDYVKNHLIYYAGPAKTPDGMPSGSFGPTTAGRMDSYVDLFQKNGGSMITLAKGNRSKQVTDACKNNGGFYLGSIGGPAAILAKNCIKKVEVLEYPELGMEAIWKIEVEDFPAFIVCDDKGNDFFKEFNM